MNQVSLKGKVSKTGRLQYTPQGIPVYEFVMAVPQEVFGKKSMGPLQMMATGDLAEELAGCLRIGKTILVNGRLWSRVFKNTKDQKVEETRVILESFQEEK